MPVFGLAAAARLLPTAQKAHTAADRLGASATDEPAVSRTNARYLTMLGPCQAGLPRWQALTARSTITGSVLMTTVRELQALLVHRCVPATGMGSRSLCQRRHHLNLRSHPHFRPSLASLHRRHRTQRRHSQTRLSRPCRIPYLQIQDRHPGSPARRWTRQGHPPHRECPVEARYR